MDFEEKLALFNTKNREQVMAKLKEVLRPDVAEELFMYAEFGFISSGRTSDDKAYEIAEAHKLLDKLSIPRGEDHDGGFADFCIAGRLDYVMPDKSKRRYDGKEWK